MDGIEIHFIIYEYYVWKRISGLVERYRTRGRSRAVFLWAHGATITDNEY